jgi:RNA recognition motif-containing protein
MTKIYVGNLPFGATEEDVRALFEAHGAVHSVSLITDRYTGQPRGFGFVEMDETTAKAAISAVNGQEISGRALKVDEAKPRRDDRGGGGGRGDRGGRW